ncbi:energy-coupling factor transport system ATP-binding protein [Bacillus oleivorans]|uniref:Energy-coupling factor transport system ATP-binding protein n=1 Tax=Bacillus oleivorans TaxID=1448271 RepID=A0A285CID0_9BACI|nr:ABC transporter ATP-binding protein [Bacillus oleivorans]SNX66753.1 energy-coupling factor transport system ATP-binding protein [Bacillus oleivorans]
MGIPIIEFNNYTFKYRSQLKPTLLDINLTIYQGEKILIVGPSGSGKSTLVHCINGLIPHSYEGEVSGKLNIKSENGLKQDLFTRSKTVGTVLQDPDGQFVGLTVSEDIAFAMENECIPQEAMKKRVKEIAKLVEVDDHLHCSIHHLSGGQKQRVALAGVMVDEVDILLFDEPLANLDPATGKYAIELIDRIHKETDKTIVIVEHRLEDVLHRSVDRIIVMDQGRIVSDTSPSELLSSNVLEKTNLREPLYIKALKYAGCEVLSTMNPAHINTLNLNGWKDKLKECFESKPLRQPSFFSEPLLELESISFRYEAGKEVLNNISLSINRGEMVSVAGKNGAGKSTLTKLICGFEKPSSGRILFNGRDLCNKTISERSLLIGMVMQNPNHMISKHKIFDEVALGLAARGCSEDKISKQVEKTLKICGLYPYRNWPISVLSFGQKKRVTIASILVLEPEMIILDEPTAGQDFRHYTEIMEFLVELNNQGVTILMITHDMHLMLEYTTRTIVIGNRGILADDKPVHIIANNQLMKQANLKETSLFELAKLAEINNPTDFVQRFIDYDREARMRWL